MYTDITLIAYAIWATKFIAKANISSRKLFLTGQKIAGNSGLDMLLHYITEDKIFSFPKHLPTQAGSCTQQEWAQLMPLCKWAGWISPCISSLLIFTGFNFASIHTRKIKRDLVPKKVWSCMSLCWWWQNHRYMRFMLLAWCNVKTPAMSLPKSREKDSL